MEIHAKVSGAGTLSVKKRVKLQREGRGAQRMVVVKSRIKAK